MTMSCASFAVLMGIVRHLSEAQGMDVFVISFWRNLLSVLVFAPWLVRYGPSVLRTRRTGLLIRRSVLMVISSTSMFFAVTLMPIAEATALSFTTPIFSAILAVLVLREFVGPRRWIALCVGMIGVVVILRPGAAAIDPAAVLPLLAALTFAAVIITGKQLAPTDSPERIAFYLVIYMIPISLVPALFFWQWPTASQLPWLLAVGAAASFNMYCISRALRIGEASQTLPYDFVRLPFVALIGFVFFNQRPEIWTWLGAVLIFGSSVYVTYRESKAAKAEEPDGQQRRTGAAPPGPQP